MYGRGIVFRYAPLSTLIQQYFRITSLGRKYQSWRKIRNSLFRSVNNNDREGLHGLGEHCKNQMAQCYTTKNNRSKWNWTESSCLLFLVIPIHASFSLNQFLLFLQPAYLRLGFPSCMLITLSMAMRHLFSIKFIAILWEFFTCLCASGVFDFGRWKSDDLRVPRCVWYNEARMRKGRHIRWWKLERDHMLCHCSGDHRNDWMSID